MALDGCENIVSPQYFLYLAFLQHEKRCSGAIARFSDNSGFDYSRNGISLIYVKGILSFAANDL